MQRKYEFKISSEYAGYTVYDYLTLQMPHYASTTLKKMLHNQLVVVNDRQIESFHRLSINDIVRILIPSDQENEYLTQAPVFDILYENDQFLVVNKPSGIPVIQERWTHENYFKDGIIAHLEKQGENDISPRIVHRIDKETSGAVLVAKSEQMERYLSRLFEENAIEKEYLAVVAGVPKDKGKIELGIAQANSYSNKMVISETGKPAITMYELIEVLGDFSLLKVKIETGRTHQIRVHLASQGYPLAVDSTYGYRNSIRLSELKEGYLQKKSNKTERPIISRLTLHAHRISFTMPDEQPFTVEAPLPKDMEVLLKMLRKYRPKRSYPSLPNTHLK
ncbi:MAG TPA: RluA family pseudouridine synthase [Planctomycetota bacterium]|nr:RluA family pseudouridine synthase [Planctomycetota bacterium]HRU52308.1 RluA family pseudouridine synthase [Planctomycetota bacterium]